MCKETKISVILCKPDEVAAPIELDNNLKALQEAVGGYIEVIYPFEDEVAIICNDEGKINGSALNRGLYDADGKLYDIIAGNFLVVGLTEDDFDSLSEELLTKYLEKFKHPEAFIRIGERIIAIKE